MALTATVGVLAACAGGDSALLDAWRESAEELLDADDGVDVGAHAGAVPCEKPWLRGACRAELTRRSGMVADLTTRAWCAFGCRDGS